jgi:hypothetical protein
MQVLGQGHEWRELRQYVLSVCRRLSGVKMSLYGEDRETEAYEHGQLA